MTVRSFLRQPSPLDLDAKRDLLRSLLTGLFVFALLLVFQPFGLSSNEPELKHLLISGYALVSSKER